MSSSEPLPSGDRLFATTRWSLVLAAADLRDSTGRHALETLCEAYWFPIYAFIRGRGRSAVDAQDLTQEFFATLLDKQYLQTADPDRGRFRAFLLTMVKHFLSNEREKAGALKRGGAVRLISIDANLSEQRYQSQPAAARTAEQAYDRQWAMSVIDQSLTRLRESYTQEGKSDLYQQLLPLLAPATDNPTYNAIGMELGFSEGAIKMAVQRMRQRYRDLLRQEVASTLNTGDDLNDEINRLIVAVRS